MSKKVTNDEIKERIISIHNDKYILDKVNYIHNKKNIILVCREHGEFGILVGNLIGNKRGCPTCGRESSKKSCLSNIKDFIKKANIKHYNKYEYTKSIYVNWKTKLTIICKIHGEFYLNPNEHLNGSGCIKCNNERILINRNKRILNKIECLNTIKTTKLQSKQSNFIEIVEKLHMKKYDYSLLEYVAVNKKVKIVCKIHGIFEQTPHHHKNGQGCPECSYMNTIGNAKKDTKLFIIESQKKHSYYYNYDKTIYTGHKNKVIINCPKHGDFEQLPYYHSSGGGCKHCSIGGSGGGTGSGKNKGNFKYSNLEFIKLCAIKHNNIYDYDKTIFNGVKENIIVICNKHGEFSINAWNHKNGQGCQLCQLEEKSMNEIDFIKKAHKVHNNKYQYLIDNDIIIKTLDKVKINCNKHGLFSQNADSHLRGSGCPLCFTKSRGEIFIKNFLEDNKIKYIHQYKFSDCINKNKLPFDFYLTETNTCIEYDGKHHFKSIPFFGGDETFDFIKKSDNIKSRYCIMNNIKLIRISYKELKNIENILKNKLLYDKLKT
jgi:hypothetical protein